MTIGILKEIAGENRVAMLPESVATLVKMNVTMLVETGAGLTAFASDTEYEQVGASIKTKANVIAGADLLIKIQPQKAADSTLIWVQNSQLLLFFHIL